jgi:exodeoxyribonuclease VII large subunit
MPVTFLAVPYRERETAKALGARWDAEVKRWYVPDGRDLTPFSTWLPGSASEVTVPKPAADTSLLSKDTKGVPLSQLLAGVSGVVSSAYRAGVWTMVEVVQATRLRGHVYLEVAERDDTGAVLAKARAMIWSRVAETILPAFQRATGMEVGPGIKLLVRAKPGFHVQHGFGIEIDQLDPDYTLGDLEARKREIRARLQAEGVFDANRRLADPWDFSAVLVIAPAHAAGRGDFEAEARRLSDGSVCTFVYAASLFQGESAPAEICNALTSALRQWPGGAVPDAIVIIRGGGAVNDLAWLNDYRLARLICDAPAPVFTGIGHERDSTILDEVAHTAFDTPSKVIAGIEKVIRSRASEAKAAFEAISGAASRLAVQATSNADRSYTAVQHGALRSLTSARERARELVLDVRHEAYQVLRAASDSAQERMADIRHGAVEQLADARRDAPVLLTQVQTSSFAAVRTARDRARHAIGAVIERGANANRRAAELTHASLASVEQSALSAVTQAKAAAQALMREVAGQGPEKTLARGFALVRNDAGRTVTSTERAVAAASVEVQFHDGSVRATIERKE